MIVHKIRFKMVSIIAVFSLLLLFPVFRFLFRKGFGETYYELLGRYLRKISYVEGKYQKDIQKEAIHFRDKVKRQWEIFGEPNKKIPIDGMNDKELHELIRRYGDITINKVKDKQLSGTIYSDSLNSEEEDGLNEVSIQTITEDNYYSEHSKRLRRLFTTAFSQSYLWNSLHADEFGIGSYLEYQVVQMVGNMFGADENIKGFVTSGGTESLMLAMRCYRNWGIDYKRHQPGESIILASKSVHAAVLKAGEAYLIRIILVDVDDKGRIDINHLKKLLLLYGDKVVAIVGSAPSYPTGVIDPINEMANLAEHYRCGFHVDCCLGGFIVNNLKHHNSKYLSIKGVTSLSADTHKNGLAPKGSSVLVTRKILDDRSLAYYSIYAYPDWSGGVYGTPKDAGSQSCVPSLTALLSMLATGVKGYEQMANDIYTTSVKLANIIKEFEGKLVLIAEPEVNVVAFKIDENHKLNKGAIYALAYEMSKRKFILNTLNGEAVHFCVTMRFVADPNALDNFRIALSESLDEVQNMNRKGEKFPGDAGMYCSLEAATAPKLSNLSYQKYIENILLGKSGAKDAIREYFLAHMNPYE